MSRSIVIAVTLFPHPDSPTRPRVSPRRTSNETPSTARVSPSRLANQTWRSSTETTGSEDATGFMVRSQLAGDLRIEEVAQAVPQQVHRQDREAEEEARVQDEAEGELHDRPALRHHVAPARNLWRRTRAEERQV